MSSACKRSSAFRRTRLRWPECYQNVVAGHDARDLIFLIQNRQVTHFAFLHQPDGRCDRFSSRNGHRLTHDIARRLSTAAKNFIKRKFTVQVYQTQPL